MDQINNVVIKYFRDNYGTSCIFEAVSMIEHKGQMTADGEGQGHYTCDVKTKDGSWYRTNDNKIPSQISRNNLSKRSVVVLYSKIKH